MKKNGKKGFTLIELVVTATILVILTTIGFYSYTKNISDARDGVRKTDVASLGSALSLYKKQRGAYPFPGDYFEIRNRGLTVAYQGYINEKVSLSTADRLPLDPDLKIPYLYATTKNKQEFQLALSLENSDNPYTLLQGDYKSIAKNILPSLLLATGALSPIEINSASGAIAIANRNLFILDTGFHNLPYDFKTSLPTSDGTDFNTLLSDIGTHYWQNSDFRSCSEIFTAGKGISPSGASDEYQILSSTGMLTNTGCIAP